MQVLSENPVERQEHCPEEESQMEELDPGPHPQPIFFFLEFLLTFMEEVKKKERSERKERKLTAASSRKIIVTT